MIELTVREYLQMALCVPVRLEVPPGAQGEFAVVEKTGSSQKDHVRHADIAVQSYAGSLLQAARLNEQVKAAMQAFAQRADVGACRLMRDYNFPDTASRRYRYQAVFAVTYYE